MLYLRNMKEAQTLSSTQQLGAMQSFPLKQLSPEKPKFVNALQLFKKPLRASRPDHMVIILRGLPGNLFFFGSLLSNL